MGDGGGGSGGFGDGRQRLAEVEMAAVLDISIDMAACGGVWMRGGCGRRVEGEKAVVIGPNLKRFGGGGEEWQLVD